MTSRQQRGSIEGEEFSREEANVIAADRCLAAACHILNFDIAELWSFGGDCLHIYGKPATIETYAAGISGVWSERTRDTRHSVSPALCKSAIADGKPVWITSADPETPLHEEIPLNTAVALPISSEFLRKDVVAVFFSCADVARSTGATDLLRNLTRAAVVACSAAFPADDCAADNHGSGYEASPYGSRPSSRPTSRPPSPPGARGTPSQQGHRVWKDKGGEELQPLTEEAGSRAVSMDAFTAGEALKEDSQSSSATMDPAILAALSVSGAFDAPAEGVREPEAATAAGYSKKSSGASDAAGSGSGAAAAAMAQAAAAAQAVSAAPAVVAASAPSAQVTDAAIEPVVEGTTIVVAPAAEAAAAVVAASLVPVIERNTISGSGSGHGHHDSADRPATARRRSSVDMSSLPLDLEVAWTELKDLEFLVNGSRCTIYTARYRGVNVVVKLLNKGVQDAAVVAGELELEMNLLRQLRHRNVVKLVGAGSVPERFLLIERLDGGTLAQRCGNALAIRDRRARFRRPVPFTYAELLRCGRQLADALCYLHESAIPGHMVIHRDLKPDNVAFGVALDGSLTLKIIDLGLSKVVKKGERDGETYRLTGETGSLRYMAPEVARCEPYNEKADVYGFGMILWEMAAMKKPYAGLGRDDFYKLVANDVLRPNLSKKWPKPFCELLQSCWAPDPRERARLKDIAERLRQMHKEVEVAAVHGSGTKEKRSRLAKFFRGEGTESR